MQKDVDKIVSTTKQLALAYRNFIADKDSMRNKYRENEAFRKRWDKARAMFTSLYDDPTEHDEF